MSYICIYVYQYTYVYRFIQYILYCYIHWSHFDINEAKGHVYHVCIHLLHDGFVSRDHVRLCGCQDERLCLSPWGSYIWKMKQAPAGNYCAVWWVLYDRRFKDMAGRAPSGSSEFYWSVCGHPQRNEAWRIILRVKIVSRNSPGNCVVSFASSSPENVHWLFRCRQLHGN